MKKKLLRVVAGATLMIAMAVSMQLNSINSESSAIIEAIEVMAVANVECQGQAGYCEHPVGEPENCTFTTEWDQYC